MRYILSLFILTISFSVFSQNKINWYELDSSTKINNNGKKIIIDLYTHWCGWCKVMDRNTFTNEEVINIVNNKFIPIKFNAEYQEEVFFNNNNFKFIKSGKRGINELAYYLTNGNLSYPMTVFLDENYNLITLLPGYHKPDFYKKVLSYIGNDFWKNMTWEEYLKNN